MASERVSQAWKFPGGLRLPPRKSASTAKPIAIAPTPAIAVLPLLQHTGMPATPAVEPGAQVLTGEPIASAEGHIGALLHAPVSGKVIAIEDRPVPHPGGLSAPCIVIEADGRDRHYEGYAPVADHLTLDPSEICRLVHEAGIVGLGGAVFPTSVKLRTAGGQPLEALILNGAECEPWISCDDMLMRERAHRVVLGAQIMLHALQVRRCVIAIEHDKPEAIAALETAAAGDDRFDIVAVTTAYPAGGERQLIQVLTHREVPTGSLPPDIGYLMQNVGTAAAVAERFRDGRPLISRIVTVAGDGVASPRNFEARLGTPFGALAAEAGGYSGEVARLIMGGPMMGFAVPTDEVPVVKATNCIWAATPRDVRATDDEMPCIRCGECARVCPAVLLPQQLYWYTRAADFDKVLDYALFDCIECGCCDFVCPSHIPLTGYFRFAKSEITAREAHRARAARAKRRYEIHAERVVWAGMHLIFGLPLNRWLPPGTQGRSEPGLPLASNVPSRVTAVLAFVFAVTWFTSTAMAAHLPGLLQESGLTPAMAIAAAALVGPAQVGARFLEFTLLRNFHPLISARVATVMHPLGALGLMLAGVSAATPFTLLHGAGNGILTIAKGTLPLAVFGPRGYGRRQGILMAPARIAQAVSPFIFAILINRLGNVALAVTALLGALACGALFMLKQTTGNHHETSSAA